MPSRRTPPHLNMPRKWLSLADAADYLGVDVRTVRRYIAAGRLVGYRLGPHALRVDAADVEQLLEPIPTASRQVG